MRKIFIILFLAGCALKSRASPIDKAYGALREYDYFKARKIFYTQLTRHRAEAAFGLATIYYRHDNPFYNLDSAYKYMAWCLGGFPLKKASLFVNETAAAALHDSVCDKAYAVFLRDVNVASAERYASVFYGSKLAGQVLCMRDSLLFNGIKNSTQSEEILTYIRTYPQSCYLPGALALLEYARYRETTEARNEAGYLAYLKQYPDTRYTQQAKEELLAHYIQTRNATGIYSYIKNIKASYFAWNALFSTEIKNYSEKDLQLFLEKYPDYPDKTQLEEEFRYWKVPFLSIKNNDAFGFIDSSGKVCIEPVYAEADDFKEGYALAEKNNLYGYINKAGRVKIDFRFEEAGSFSQQAAMVQKGKAVYLIDHVGKKISADYEEIADFADNLAIVKKDGLYGAIDHSGGEIIPPGFSYLSDFSENAASFMQHGKYGFINKQGFTIIAPIYTWVSSFKNNRCRVKADNRLGVIDKKGDFVLKPLYDMIDGPYKGVYVLVKNNLYGFADTSGCLLTEMKYSYNPALKPSDLTNGHVMRLIKNNKEELQDRNGIRYFSQQNLAQILLSNTDMIAGRKKNRYQFYSAAKAPSVKAEFIKVEADSNYWYACGDKVCQVYTISLKEKVFSLKAESIRALNPSFFAYTTEDGTGIATKKGTVALEAFFDEISATQIPDIFYVERKEKGAYFNASTLQFIWKENGFNPAYIADEE